MSEFGDIRPERRLRLGDARVLVRRPSIRVEGEFGNWCEEQAALVIAKIPHAEVALKAFELEKLAGYYDWGQPGVGKHLQLHPKGGPSLGQKTFCEMVVEQHNPGFQEFDALWVEYWPTLIRAVLVDMYKQTQSDSLPGEMRMGGSSGHVGLADVLATMVRRPFNLSVDEVLNMDRWTVFNIYLRARDKDGNVKLRSARYAKEKPTTTLKEDFYYLWDIKRNVPKEQIDKAWKEYEEGLKTKVKPRGR